MTLEAGVLSGDLRRFTGTDPQQVRALLRRCCACAEDVVFPEALIDKPIGDEGMARYLPAACGREILTWHSRRARGSGEAAGGEATS
jgi:hypothetical protein